MPTTAYYSNDEDMNSGRKYLPNNVNYIKWTPGTKIKSGQLGLGGSAVIPTSAYDGGQALYGQDLAGTLDSIRKYSESQNKASNPTAYYANDSDLVNGKKYLPSSMQYAKWDPSTQIGVGNIGLGGSAVIPDSAYSGGRQIAGVDAAGTAAALQDYMAAERKKAADMANATANAQLQYNPQIDSVGAKLQALQNTMAQAKRRADAEKLAANNLALDNISQIRRLMDNNRSRTNETMNTQGLMNSGINGAAQSQINANEGSSLRNNQAELRKTLAGIQDWLNGVNSDSQGTTAELQAQKAGLLAQIPALAQSIYDKQQADAEKTAWDRKIAIANLMRELDGKPTFEREQWDKSNQQWDKNFALQEDTLLGNHNGLPTLDKQRLDNQVDQYGSSLYYDNLNRAADRAISKENADTNRMQVTNQYPAGSAPSSVPTSFWNAAVSAGDQTGVDPVLIAAIGKHETGYGTLGAGREGYSLGYGYPGPGQGIAKYKDNPGEFTNQTLSAAKQIAGYLQGGAVTLDSLTDFMNNSWKPGDKNWANAVWKDYQQLKSTTGGGQINKKLTPSEQAYQDKQDSKKAMSDALAKLQEKADQHWTRDQILDWMYSNASAFNDAGVPIDDLAKAAKQAYQWNGNSATGLPIKTRYQ